MGRFSQSFLVACLMVGIVALAGGAVCARAATVAAPSASKAPVLKPLSVTLPDGSEQTFPDLGPGKPSADAINNNCLACHSADMVMSQPMMAKETWPAIVHKMITVYKAPVAAEDVDGIVAYLQALKGK